MWLYLVLVLILFWSDFLSKHLAPHQCLACCIQFYLERPVVGAGFHPNQAETTPYHLFKSSWSITWNRCLIGMKACTHTADKIRRPCSNAIISFPRLPRNCLFRWGSYTMFYHITLQHSLVLRVDCLLWFVTFPYHRFCVKKVGNAIKTSLHGAALKSNKEGTRSIQVEITPTSSRISRNAVTSMSIRGHRWKRHGEEEEPPMCAPYCGSANSPHALLTLYTHTHTHTREDRGGTASIVIYPAHRRSRQRLVDQLHSTLSVLVISPTSYHHGYLIDTFICHLFFFLLSSLSTSVVSEASWL